MKLTREILHSAGTNGIGFNRQQLILLGVQWPPVKGWLTRLIGREISDETWQKVLAFKDKKARRQAQQHLMKFL